MACWGTLGAAMPDTRIELSEAEFEDAASHVPTRWWATGERLLYHKAIENVSNWRAYSSPGFRKLTPAQQTLLYWIDFTGEVSNGGMAQFYQNKSDIIDETRAALHALDWPELAHRLDIAHFSHIAPSKNAKQWTAQKRRREELQRKELLKRWRAGIDTYDPLPIWLIDYWREHGRGPFSSEKAREGWRKRYRNHPPDASMLWVFAAQGGASIVDHTPDEEEFNKWFWSDETKAQSAHYVPRYIRAQRNELALIV